MMWDFMWVPRAIKVRKRSLWDHVSLEGYMKEVNTDLVLEGRREYDPKYYRKLESLKQIVVVHIQNKSKAKEKKQLPTEMK